MSNISPEDNIELFEIILFIYKKKITFIVCILIGLFIGCIYTYQHTKLFQVDFKINIEHPIFDNFLHESAFVKKQLARYELNPNSNYPKYSIDYEKNIFRVLSDSQDIKQFAINDLSTALKKEIINTQQVAKRLNKDNQGVRFNIEIKDAVKIGTILWGGSKQNILAWTNEDILNIEVNEVVDSLKFEFSPVKELYPRPFKHGLIGSFLGFIFATFFLIIRLILKFFKVK